MLNIAIRCVFIKKAISTGVYKIRDKARVHFVTFAVTEWVDVFTRKEYRDIVLESIRYYQKEKGLVLYAWCIMSNHLHLVLSAVNNDTSDILRDFKKFTSKQIIKAIADNTGESRKEWMLKIFAAAGTQNSRNINYQFWRQDNHPVELYSEHFTKQKIHYIHENPVVTEIVDKAEAYLYSSAKVYNNGKNCGLLTIELL